jgi:hypothetical protein
MLTFTMRHHKGQRLATLWDALQAGHRGVTSGKAHQGEKLLYGVPTTRVVRSGARAGQEVATTVLPWVRVVEVTHGAAGWHVHVHLLLFLPGGMTDAELAKLYGGMWVRWNAGVTSAGVDGSLKVNKARFYDDASADALGPYVTKGTYSDEDKAGTAMRAGMEMTRGDLKAGRYGNRSHMQLLRDANLNRVPDDLALWAEFEAASKSRRNMTWAQGARSLLGLDEVEATDEEVADEEVGTARDTVVFLSREGARTLRHGAGQEARALTAAELGLDALVAYLDSLGVEFWFPNDDPEVVAARRRTRV